jgi:hypothetical protein
MAIPSARRPAGDSRPPRVGTLQAQPPPARESVGLVVTGGGGVPQVPAAGVAELHSVPSGHPLPPVPRQPSVQVCVSPQIRPLVTVPQSPSLVQPQVPVVSQVFERQTVPSVHAPVPTG